MDTLEQMNDLYVTAWLEGTDKQNTDVHWRAKKGKGSWNHRMIFEVELGHSTQTMKFPYLHIQMWDQDVLKWNDIIAECTIDVEKWIKKASRKGAVVECFKDLPKPTAADKKKLKQLEEAGEDDPLLYETSNPLMDEDDLQDNATEELRKVSMLTPCAGVSALFTRLHWGTNHRPCKTSRYWQKCARIIKA